MKKLPHESWANWYDFVYENTYGSLYGRLGKAQLQLIKELISPGSHIIEYGAGTGRLSLPLAAESYEVIAVERSSGMLEQLETKADLAGLNIKGYHTTIEGFKGDAADLALAVFTVITYTIDDNSMCKSIQNIAQYLKSGGLFLFDLPSTAFFEQEELFDHRSKELNRRVSMKPMGDDLFLYSDKGDGIMNGEKFSYEDEFVVRYWRIDELADMLEEAGLKRVEVSLDRLNFSGANYYLYEKEVP